MKRPDIGGFHVVPDDDFTLADALWKHIERMPEMVAIVDGERTVDFGELGVRILRLTRRFREHSGGTCGVYLDPGDDLIIALWSALESGIAYLPLPPDYPDQRVRFMIRDSGCDFLVTSSRRAAEVREMYTGPLVIVDDDAGVSEPLTRRSLPPRTEIAYVLSTSGSTGAPKGVEVPRSALRHQIAWTATGLGLRPGSRVVQKTPAGFDAAHWELLANATGATIIVGGGLHRRPSELLDCIRRHSATHVQVVPTLLGELCADPMLAVCTTLRLVAIGGEPLSGALARRVQGLLPTAVVVNLYGPTETTINVTSHVFAPADYASTEVPIGKPVPGHRLFILDEVGRAVELSSAPASAVGELAISGPQLARGYRNNDPATRASFTDLEVGGGEVLRTYRTGDIVEKSGELLYFRGRRDRQVSIRGHRIELDEIGAALEAHSGVRRAFVTLADGAQAITAHVEPTSEGAVETSELRRFAAAVLPAFMVPTIALTDRLPVLSNGKVDRSALTRPRPERGRTVHSVLDVGEVEQTLSTIWRNTLGLESGPSLKADASFAGLGGASLEAVRMADAVERAFGAPWTVDTVLSHDGFAEQVKLLKSCNMAPQGRLVTLSGAGGSPMVLWPGLGGHLYGMRALARAIAVGGNRCYGVRSQGVMAGESPPMTPQRAARDDADLLDELRSEPITVVGYSAGCRRAVDVVKLRSAAGIATDALVLIAPGSPLEFRCHAQAGDDPFRYPAFVRTVQSVFTGGTGEVAEHPTTAVTRTGAVSGIAAAVGVDHGLVDRIASIAEADFRDRELRIGVEDVPTVVMCAEGDDDRYLPELRGGRVSHVDLSGDHYEVIQAPGVVETVAQMRSALGRLGYR